MSCKIVNIIPTKNNITLDKWKSKWTWKIWKGKHSGWSWPQTYKILTRSSLNAIWLTVLWQTDRHFKESAICPNASILVKPYMITFVFWNNENGFLYTMGPSQIFKANGIVRRRLFSLYFYVNICPFIPYFYISDISEIFQYFYFRVSSESHHYICSHYDANPNTTQNFLKIWFSLLC